MQYVQFLDRNGNETFVRPSRVIALREATKFPEQPLTMILMDNRETFVLRGDVRAIVDGLVAADEAVAAVGSKLPPAIAASVVF